MSRRGTMMRTEMTVNRDMMERPCGVCGWCQFNQALYGRAYLSLCIYYRPEHTDEARMAWVRSQVDAHKARGEG